MIYTVFAFSNIVLFTLFKEPQSASVQNLILSSKGKMFQKSEGQGKCKYISVYFLLSTEDNLFSYEESCTVRTYKNIPII